MPRDITTSIPEDLKAKNPRSKGYSTTHVKPRFRLVFVRYLDHVQFNRFTADTIQPQVRESVGWLIYECKEYVTIAWDRDGEPSTLKGGDPKASGNVFVKSAILELVMLDAYPAPLKETLKWHLNSQESICKNEYALQSKKRKTQRKGKPT